jgi:hypothetical protein
MNLTIGNLQHAETLATNPGKRFPGSANETTTTATVREAPTTT